MDRVLGGPTTCPHGNPIPGSDYHAPDATRLVDDRGRAAFTVSRIPEELEFTPGLLDFLECLLDPARVTRAGSRPRRRMATMTVEIDGRHVGVGSFASARILVTA